MLRLLVTTDLVESTTVELASVVVCGGVTGVEGEAEEVAVMGGGRLGWWDDVPRLAADVDCVCVERERV